MRRAAYRDKYRSSVRPRSPEQLQDDLVVAFDQIRSLKDRLWVVTGALMGCCGVILWLANQLMSCLGVVHAASKVVH